MKNNLKDLRRVRKFFYMDVSYLARGNGWKKLIVYMMQDYLLDEDDNLEGGV
ncbi:hypothetical protein JHK87_027451 [Glycine soja]|nr:hypothetical protein JHK87_027451 [Glycine soja]